MPKLSVELRLAFVKMTVETKRDIYERSSTVEPTAYSSVE